MYKCDARFTLAIYVPSTMTQKSSVVGCPIAFSCHTAVWKLKIPRYGVVDAGRRRFEASFMQVGEFGQATWGAKRHTKKKRKEIQTYIGKK